MKKLILVLIAFSLIISLSTAQITSTNQGITTKRIVSLDPVSSMIRNFVDLLDTPSSYLGQSGNCVLVNAGENGLEFGSCGAGGGGAGDKWIDTGSFIEPNSTFADNIRVKIIEATDWTNFTGTESQITDLTHTGNPFNQSLNTTDDVVFNSLNVTTHINSNTSRFGDSLNYWDFGVRTISGQPLPFLQAQGANGGLKAGVIEGGLFLGSEFTDEAQLNFFSTNLVTRNWAFRYTNTTGEFKLSASGFGAINPVFEILEDVSIEGILNVTDWSNVSIIESQITDLTHTGNSSWNQSLADSLYAILGYGDDWNKTYADTLYSTGAHSTAGNLSWNQSLADTIYLNLSGGNADQNIDIGAYNLTGDYIFGKTTTPINNDDLVNKNYVDDSASSTAFDFFFNNASSDINGHYNMTESNLGLPESSLTSSTFGVGTFSAFNWTSLIGKPLFRTLRHGTYTTHFHLSKTGQRTVKVTPKLYNISSDGTSRNLLLTFETSEEITLTPTGYNLHGVIPNQVIIPSGDRLNMELEVVVSGGGNDIEIIASQEGDIDSHLTVETSTSAFENIYIKRDGSNNLTGNWNAGEFNITTSWFKGLFNWTISSIYLAFDGSTLTLDDALLNTNFNQTDEINSVNTTSNIENLGFTQGIHTVDTDTNYFSVVNNWLTNTTTSGINTTSMELSNNISIKNNDTFIKYGDDEQCQTGWNGTCLNTECNGNLVMSIGCV